MAQFDDLRCGGQHSHYQLSGSSRTDEMKVWPWKLAERLIEGIVRLKRQLSRDQNKQTTRSAFPEIAIGLGGISAAVA